MADDGSRGNDEGGCRQGAAPHIDLVRSEKPAVVLIEGEAAQLFDAVVGEVPDQPVLAVDDGTQVGADVAGAQAEFAGTTQQRHDVGGAQDRLARHAAAQDAEAPEGPRVDDGHIGAGIAGRACGGIPRRTTAKYDHIVVEVHHQALVELRL